MAGFYRGRGSTFYPNQARGAGKRFFSSDGRDEPLRKVPAPPFVPRAGFEPVRFVSGGCGPLRTANETENNQRRWGELHGVGQWDHDRSSYGGQLHRPAFNPEPLYRADSWRDWDQGFNGGSTSNFMARTEQEYTAKYEAHSTNSNSWCSQPQRHNSFGGGNRSGLGFSRHDHPSTSRSFSQSPANPQPEVQHPPSPHSTLRERQRVIANVAYAIKASENDLECKTAYDVLSRCVQDCKSNTEYIYVHLNDIPTADLPKNKKVPNDGFACELRCQQVYITTAYSGSKNEARDRASEQAVRLFMRLVEVREVERQHKNTVFNDLVLCQTNCPTPELVPALCNPLEKPAVSVKELPEYDPQYKFDFMARTEQEYTAKYEAHSTDSNSWCSQPQRHDSFGGGNHSGLGFSRHNQPSTSSSFSQSPANPQPEVQRPPSPHSTLRLKQRIIANVAYAIKASVDDPECKAAYEVPNYNFILSRCIQGCKCNPEYIYAHLNDIPTADLPKNKKLPNDGFACELRCQQVYITTGYSGSKNGARDRASEQAVRLFMRLVEVREVERKHKNTMFNDLVVCQTNCPTPELVPALCNPQEKPVASVRESPEYDPQKPWWEFEVIGHALDPVSVLNNSATYNRMKIEYKFDQHPNNIWDCKVFVQDELLGMGTGYKRNAKQMASEDALKRLRSNQELRQQSHQQDEGNSQFGQRNLSDLVILDNSSNAICTLNDTAQFNKITTDYKFSLLPSQCWKCEVFMLGQFVAAADGPKKKVKHLAAEKALKKLKQMCSVVKANVRKDCNGDAISRSQIMGRSGEEAKEQEIKEDNIGNRLLRKMGWKGGGLGRDGEGISEPIRVKEQFTREGLGLDADSQLNKRDLEDVIRKYVASDRQDELRFSTELTNDERKQIHQISKKYGLRSKSYGQGKQRYLMVSRRVHKDQLLGQLLQEGQVGRYELIKPLTSQ